MTALLLWVALATAPEWHSADTRSRYMKGGDGSLTAALTAAHGKPLNERLVAISEGFLDTPYVVSPLGEGRGPDADPTFRLDAVDCLTFVEETMGLALADGRSGLPKLLEQIRYGSEPVYEDRNHLMEAQWLPRNIAKGFLRDVTDQYGGADATAATKVIGARTWQSRTSASLQLPEGKRPVGTFTFRLVPLEHVLEHARAVPSGTLMVVVREDKELMPTRITHLGFLIQKKGRPVLRHAARNVFGRVVDEDLENFLTRNGRYEKWKVSGVSFYEVTEPPRQTAQRVQ